MVAASSNALYYFVVPTPPNTNPFVLLTGSTLSVERRFLSCITVAEHAYFVGGFDSNSNPLNSVDAVVV